MVCWKLKKNNGFLGFKDKFVLMMGEKLGFCNVLVFRVYDFGSVIVICFKVLFYLFWNVNCKIVNV